MLKASSEQSARGAKEIVRFLEDHGIGHVFGLPGSTLTSVLHELQNSKVKYVPTVHESATVAAADGYARIAGIGLAMIYMVPGTANAMANLYNAWRDESSLIVLSSQQVSSLRTREGTVGEHDLVAMVGPFTRLSHELSAGTSVRRWLELARRASLGPPSGPTFLSLPQDVLENEGPVVAERATSRISAGPPEVGTIVERLQGASRPLLVVGGQIRRCGGADLVEKLAEEYGIAVAYEPGFNDRLSIAPGHPNVVGNLIDISGAAAEAAADLVLVVGARYINEAHYRTQPYFPKALFVAHINADPAKLEQTHVANLSCACDPAAFLRALLSALPPPPHEILASRLSAIKAVRDAPLPNIPFARAISSYAEAVQPLHDALEHGWVVDEAVMGSAALVAALNGGDGRRYCNTTGGSLGWASGAAAGVALASGEPVTCVLGDGALRFGLHGLWTAVAEKLPITFVVLDNGGYGSTRYFERAYVQHLGPNARPQRPSYYNMDLRDLGPSPAQMLQGFGLPCSVTPPGQSARPAIEHAWKTASDGPNAVVLQIPFEDDF
jgi:thiamine pyrophosphate-dependent acetolactate synthase large subunit-like protein